jgi:uncharacterized protein YndB with AHSA1/START domain
MTVIDIQKDVEACSLTVTAEFAVPVSRAWELWADPRQLERWWGPPTYPATVVDHDLAPGGRVTYFMTGPEGDRHHGWWRVRSVDAPNGFEIEDGFADEHFVPNPELPVTIMRMELQPRDDGGTTMTIHSTYPSPEAMQQMIEMGMEEGLREAMGQIPEILAG